MKFFVREKKRKYQARTICRIDLEAELAIKLFREEFIRELYSIKGGKGACMVIEAKDEMK